MTLTLPRLARTADAPGADMAYPSASVDLLHTVDELNEYLAAAVERREWLDAFLFAAGMSQVVEDYLEERSFVHRAGEYVKRLNKPGCDMLGEAILRVDRVVTSTRTGSRQFRNARSFRRQLCDLTESMASLAVAAAREAGNPAIAFANGIRTETSQLPRQLRSSVLRLPSCFRSFDQRPEDIAELVTRFAARWPEPSRPVVVVGIRTSGSYLAPIASALLRASGLGDVRAFTLRPGQRLRREHREVLEEMVKAGGKAIIVDDPPVTGGAYASVASGLRSAGVPRDGIVLFLPLFGATGVPMSLRDYNSVVLSWEDWDIHRSLQPAVLQRLLSRRFPSAMVGEPRRVLEAEREVWRGHAQALFRVPIEYERGRRDEIHVHAKGTGLGYFGAHSTEVTQRLANWLPCVYGTERGVIFREWFPPGGALTARAVDAQAAATSIAGYVRERTEALAVREDRAAVLADRKAAWQGVADILGASFGRARPLMRPVVQRATRVLCRVPTPMVVDGSMSLDHWFATPSGVRKVDADERAYSSRDLACYDPIFDLAGATLGAPEGLAQQLRGAYESMTGQLVAPEHWLLYRLLHCRHRWGDPISRLELDRDSARAIQDYLGGVFFSDAAQNAGPLCGVGIDGVLESNMLGFPAASPAGCLALRALTLHGYRPLLASGRSLAEVRERCIAYRLAGGVGEYGAVVWHAGRDAAIELTAPADREPLERLRHELGSLPGVFVDPSHERCVRAFAVDDSGRRQGLDEPTITAAMSRSGVDSAVQTVQGRGQTDFILRSVTKGLGLQALASALGVKGVASREFLAFAIGDSAPDIAMLENAGARYAPANADSAVREADAVILNEPFQRGFSVAVQQFLGHRPGGCSICRPPIFSRGARLLLAALSAQDRGRPGKLATAIRLFTLSATR